MQNWIHVKRYLSTLVRLPSPASQSCSNDARGTSCAEQRRYTTRRWSRCRPPEDLPDSEGACSTSSRCEHKRVTDPSLGPPGVFKDGLHGINPNEMHRQALPGPGGQAREQASHHLHRRSARPCHRKWCPAVETGFDMQCIDARYDTVPASMVVRAAPHWRPPSTCAPPNITDAHTTTTGIKASRLLTPLYQTKARTARRHSSTNTARRMARSPFILTWAKQVYITQNTRYFSRQQDMMKSIICITDSLFLWQSRLLPVIGSLRAQPWQSKANTGMMLPQ